MGEKEALLARLDDLERKYSNKCSADSRLKQMRIDRSLMHGKFFFQDEEEGYEKYYATVVTGEVYSVEKGFYGGMLPKNPPEVYGDYDAPPAAPVLEVEKPEDTKKTPEQYGVRNLEEPVKMERQKFYLPTVTEAIVVAAILIGLLVLLHFDFKSWFFYFVLISIGFVLYVSFLGKNVSAYKKNKKEYPQLLADYEKDRETIQNYAVYSKEFDEYLVNSYPQLHEEYEKARIRYNAEVEEYVPRYNAWVDKWFPILKERQAQADDRYSEEISKQGEMLREYETAFENAKDGFLGDKYIDHIDDIKGILKDGRADTLKEALNVLEDDWHKGAMEAAAAAQAAAMAAQAAAVAAAERERTEAERENAAIERSLARQEEETARRDGKRQCISCANYRKCRVSSSNRGNCASWRAKF